MIQVTEFGGVHEASVLNVKKKELAIGEIVTCRTVSGKQITGKVEKFLENTVVVSVRGSRCLVDHKELKEQGFMVRSEKYKGKPWKIPE